MHLSGRVYQNVLNKKKLDKTCHKPYNERKIRSVLLFKGGISVLKMLFADDEPMALVSAVHAFGEKNRMFDAPITTQDSFEALRILQESRIDLCVIDIRMPGITGLKIVERCAREKISTKFAVLSGYSDFSYAQEAMRQGVLEYCLKPVEDEMAAVLLDRLTAQVVASRHTKDRELAEQISQGKTDLLKYCGIDGHRVYQIAVAEKAELFAELEKRGKQNALFFLEDRVLCVLAGETALESLKGAAVSEPVYSVSSVPALFFKAMTLSPREWKNGRYFCAPQYINESFVSLIREVEERACENPSLADLAKKYCLNYNYCSELFKKVLGKNFSDYVTELRMRRAADLLANTGKPITAVAVESGYSEYHYFANVFKSYYGETPTSFRSSTKACRNRNGRG